MSKVFINVGGTGTGKTTTTKEIMRGLNVPSYIYDVNGEYSEFGRSADTRSKFSEFLKMSTEKKNTCIVFEEATIFFSHASSGEEIKNLLVRKRHTKNFIILNFHSLRQVPLYILDFANYIIIGKTNDNPETIRKKYEDYNSIYDAFLTVQCSEDNYYKEFVKLSN